MMKSTGYCLLALALASPCAIAQSAGGKWAQSQETNAAESYNYARFTLAGSFGSAQRDGAASQPALVVNCVPPGSAAHRSELLNATLYAGAPLKVIYVEPEEIHGTNYFPKVAVEYRTDGAGDVRREQWNPGVEKTSASIPEEALKKMLRARSVAISANNDQGAKLDMKFDMPDSAQLKQACNM